MSNQIDSKLVRSFLKDMLIHDGYDAKLVEDFLEAPDIVEFINLLVIEFEKGNTNPKMKTLQESIENLAKTTFRR